ncbi:MAG: hypothetical protein IKU82_03705 [Clostridia bacterium]|nr:hypothetical protein [Clostridia bacterium]
MNEIIQNERKVKCKILIVALSIIALLVGSLSDLIYLSDWFINGNIFSTFKYIFGSIIDFNIDLYLVQTVVYLFFDLTNILITVLPCILIIAYVLFLYKKFSAKFILSIVFLLLLCPMFRSATYLILDIIFSFFFNYGFSYSDLFYYLKSVLINILPRLPLILAAILVLFGIKLRVVYIIPLLLSAIPAIWWFFSACIEFLKIFVRIFSLDIRELLKELFVYNSWIYGDIFWGVGLMAITLAVIIFIVANKDFISKKGKVIVEDSTLKNLSPEDALEILNQNLENGTITAEEYQSQREIILNKI